MARNESMTFNAVAYSEMDGRQQEYYNSTKLAAVLADYGYECHRTASDRYGADLLVYHPASCEQFTLQLKSRATIDKKYIGRNLQLAFPHKSDWYIVPHDELIDIFANSISGCLDTKSWTEKGIYHQGKPSVELLAALSRFKVPAKGEQ